MKPFDPKFVHFIWDDELKGKEVFYADEIDDLIEEVNGETNDSGRKILYDKSCSHRHPFRIDENDIEDCYRFVYYDPNYECKIAYNEDKQIQAKLNGFEDKNWIDVKQPTWEGNLIFRIKPEENKKYWIIAQNSWFTDSEAYERFGPMYHVEEQQDGYSRSNPPLKKDFNSYEEAQTWLNKYNSENVGFERVSKAVGDLIKELEKYQGLLNNHEYINRNTFEGCFKRLEETICSSPNNQVIFIKEEDE